MLLRMKRLFILSDCQSQSTIRDVLNNLKTKVELSQPDIELRLLEVFYRKIYEVPWCCITSFYTVVLRLLRCFSLLSTQISSLVINLIFLLICLFSK
ncbi:hypothetical protein P3S68_019273 [Capsicum galapagoense]